MKIVLTSDWSFEQLQPYTKDITAAMKKLQDRFPNEVEVGHLAGEIIKGNRQLWLILNDDDSFASFVLTTIEVNNATGLKTLLIPSLAGQEGGGVAATPLIEDVEKWGAAQGCNQCLVYGRLGWKRPLAKQGYDLDIAVFRKPL